MVKIVLSKFEENVASEESLQLIRSLCSQFEEEQYRMIEQIRMYKKYVREAENIFLEFEHSGVLKFISGNREIPLLNKLKDAWEPGKPIFNFLFGENQKLSSQIKRTLRGSLKSEKLFEIDKNMKARITLHNRKIESIHILIEECDESCDSLKEDTIIIGKSLRSSINKRSAKGSSNSLTTMRELEKENPGILNEGWLELFLNQKNVHSGDGN